MVFMAIEPPAFIVIAGHNIFFYLVHKTPICFHVALYYCMGRYDIHLRGHQGVGSMQRRDQRWRCCAGIGRSVSCDIRGSPAHCSLRLVDLPEAVTALFALLTLGADPTTPILVRTAIYN